MLYQCGAGEDAFRDESKVTDFSSVAETIKRWSAQRRTATFQTCHFNMFQVLLKLMATVTE